MTPPWIWLSVVSALTARPQSWTATTRSTLTLPVSVSTSTSANWAPAVKRFQASSWFSARSAVAETPWLGRQLAGLVPGQRRASDRPGPRRGRRRPGRTRRATFHSRATACGELLLGLAGRAPDRRRARGRRRGAARARARRACRVSPMRDRDPLERQAELLGRDDRDHRAGAGAEVLDAVLDLGRSVAVDRDGRPRARCRRCCTRRRRRRRRRGGSQGSLVLRRASRVLPADLLGADPELLAAHLGGVVLHPELERDPSRACRASSSIVASRAKAPWGWPGRAHRASRGRRW